MCTGAVIFGLVCSLDSAHDTDMVPADGLAETHTPALAPVRYSVCAGAIME